jgi:hypothetical protein
VIVPGDLDLSLSDDELVVIIVEAGDYDEPAARFVVDELRGRNPSILANPPTERS